MAEKLDPKEIVSVEELIKTIVYAQDALVRVLQRKGIPTEREVLDEIKRIRIEHEKNKNFSH